MASRDARLARYVRREVWAHGAGHRRRMAAAGVADGRLRTVADLERIPAQPLTEVADAADLVLRPTPTSLRHDAARGLAFRHALARLTGRSARFDERRLTPRYKPVHWVVASGVPIGSSEADLDRLAGLGAAWLSAAGIRRTDAIISVVPPGPHLDAWQLALGARRARVPCLLLEATADPEMVASLRPTVLAGHIRDLTRLVDGVPLDGVHTVLVTGAPVEEGERRRLATRLALPETAVLSGWSPPGVRALWTECRGGQGLHTDPDTEVVQLLDPLSGQPVPPGADGEVVWTALGWHGTVLLRLRTGLFARLEGGPCPTCRRSGPRVVVHSAVPTFLAVLDRHDGVDVWRAELREVAGDEELLVFLAVTAGADPETVVRTLDEHLSATQYIVLPAAQVAARVAEDGGLRLDDRRGGAPGGTLPAGGQIAGS